ncbi:hypothetical protein [Bacillus ndiopicus]|uniref:hypothetical protein n=1 Tax=Bacillus ndiopicus TaxID=1347368 RepID=UPI0005AAAE55|nr:hypothetical protein [Bacillus ndiopicus]
MVMFVAVIVIVIIGSQWTALRDNKEPATKWLFFIILILGTVIAAALSFDIQIPSPLDLVTFIFQPISDALKALLQT